MNIDEQAREEWVTRTDGFERVKTTLESTRQPKSAGDIADEAMVSEKTTRKYLQRLADLNAASAIQDEEATRYKRDTDAFIAQRIRELRTDQSQQDLIDGIQRMRAELESLREKHNVGSSTELVMSLESGEHDEAWQDLRIGRRQNGTSRWRRLHCRSTEPQTEITSRVQSLVRVFELESDGVARFDHAITRKALCRSMRFADSDSVGTESVTLQQRRSDLLSTLARQFLNHIRDGRVLGNEYARFVDTRPQC